MLRRAVCALCTAICAALVALSPALMERLPAPPEGLTSRIYQGWSGVIRLQVYQGFRSGTGSIVPWLNECLSAYEKRNPGVYVHVKSVSQAELARYGDEPRPDMLVFTPGALGDAQGLLPQQQVEGLVEALNAACSLEGVQYAYPLCYGGYGMLVNAELMAELPTDWAQAIERVYTAPARRQSGTYALQVPGEARWAEVTADMLGALPEPGDMLPEGYLECSATQAWNEFKRGNVACIPANQWHLRQMALLSAEGEAPAWAFYPSQTGYTDQYFAVSVVDTGLDGAQARAQVCRDIAMHLLSPESQEELDMALMLPAREGMALYASSDDMAALELAYRGMANFEALFG